MARARAAWGKFRDQLTLARFVARSRALLWGCRGDQYACRDVLGILRSRPGPERGHPTAGLTHRGAATDADGVQSATWPQQGNGASSCSAHSIGLDRGDGARMSITTTFSCRAKPAAHACHARLRTTCPRASAHARCGAAVRRKNTAASVGSFRSAPREVRVPSSHTGEALLGYDAAH